MASDERAILEQNKAVVRRLYEEVVAAGDHALLDTLVAEDVYDWHAAGRGRPRAAPGSNSTLWRSPRASASSG